MRQETAGGRAERRKGGRSAIAAGSRQGLVATPAPAPERYVDRHTPGIFAKWWAGLVATAPDMVCNGIK